MSILVGIDPGKSGGVSFYNTELKYYSVQMMPKTEADIATIFRSLKSVDKDLKAIIENVHAFPGQGVVSMFSFGQNYGFLRGCLVSLMIPFTEVTPQKWMGYFGFQRKKGEDKKLHKIRILQKAQNLFPNSSVALQTADSLMLAEYLRVTSGEQK